MTFFQTDFERAILLSIFIVFIILVSIFLIGYFIVKKLSKKRAGRIFLGGLIMLIGFFSVLGTLIFKILLFQGYNIIMPILFIILGFAIIYRASTSKEKGVVNQDKAIPSTIETSTQKKFCTNCGSPLSKANSQFCKYCGKKIE